MSKHVLGMSQHVLFLQMPTASLFPLSLIPHSTPSWALLALLSAILLHFTVFLPLPLPLPLLLPGLSPSLLFIISLESDTFLRVCLVFSPRTSLPYRPTLAYKLLCPPAISLYFLYGLLTICQNKNENKTKQQSLWAAIRPPGPPTVPTLMAGTVAHKYGRLSGSRTGLKCYCILLLKTLFALCSALSPGTRGRHSTFHKKKKNVSLLLLIKAENFFKINILHGLKIA